MFALSFEEVFEAFCVKRGGRRGGWGGPANAVVGLVRLDDHRQRVPADDALDASLDFATTGERRLLGCGDAIDVGSVGGEGLLDTAAARMIGQLTKQAADTGRPAGLQDIVQRLEPFACLERFELGRVFRSSVPHSSSAGPCELIEYSSQPASCAIRGPRQRREAIISSTRHTGSYGHNALL